MTKKILGLFLVLAFCGIKAQTLKQTVGKHFLIGAAVNEFQTSGHDTKSLRIIREQYNSIAPENCLKSASLHPEENRYSWENGDRFVAFAEENGLVATGHCLVWHSQTADWMFKGPNGEKASRELLIKRMEEHIKTVVGHYRGRLRGWDVVNEVLNDDGTLRKSPYLEIIGPDYIEMAFRFAHEADPEAELYINDYSLSLPRKRDGMCWIVRNLKSKGCRVDAVGMQSHLSYDFPDLKVYEASIDSFAACGVKVMATELDMSMLPNPWNFSGADINNSFEYNQKMNPYVNGLPKEMEDIFTQRYLDLFRIYKKHEHQITRITFWGITDGSSWLNGFPIKGRTNYPLLFDRQYKAKPVVKKIVRLFKK